MTTIKPYVLRTATGDKRHGEGATYGERGQMMSQRTRTKSESEYRRRPCLKIRRPLVYTYIYSHDDNIIRYITTSTIGIVFFSRFFSTLPPSARRCLYCVDTLLYTNRYVRSPPINGDTVVVVVNDTRRRKSNIGREQISSADIGTRPSSHVVAIIRTVHSAIGFLLCTGRNKRRYI